VAGTELGRGIFPIVSSKSTIDLTVLAELTGITGPLDSWVLI